MFETSRIREMFGPNLYTDGDFRWILTRRTWRETSDNVRIMTLVFKRYENRYWA